MPRTIGEYIIVTICALALLFVCAASFIGNLDVTDPLLTIKDFQVFGAAVIASSGAMLAATIAFFAATSNARVAERRADRLDLIKLRNRLLQVQVSAVLGMEGSQTAATWVKNAEVTGMSDDGDELIDSKSVSRCLAHARLDTVSLESGDVFWSTEVVRKLAMCQLRFAAVRRSYDRSVEVHSRSEKENVSFSMMQGTIEKELADLITSLDGLLTAVRIDLDKVTATLGN